MPVYRQISQKIEDGFGLVTTAFCISDSYVELFSEAALDIDIIEFGSSKKDLETSTGAQKEDEEDFTATEAKIGTVADRAAFDLLLTADMASIWVAQFIHEGETFVYGNKDDLEFSGKVRPKMPIKEAAWYNSEYSSTVNALREVKYTAQTFATAVLDKSNLKAVVEDGVKSAGIIETLVADTAFKSANVKDLMVDRSTGLEYYYRGAVQLNKALDALRLIAVERVRTEIPDFNLTFSPTFSGYKFAHLKAFVNDYCFQNWTLENTQPRSYALLNPDSDDSPWVSWRLFEVNKIDNNGIVTNNTTEENYAFSRFKSFTDLLYNIAVCFGCVLTFKQLGGNHIQLELTPILTAEAPALYIRDAVSSDIDTQNAGKETIQTWKGRSNYAALEGNEVCDVNGSTLDADSITPLATKSYNASGDEKGSLLALAIAPTVYRWMHDTFGNRPINTYELDFTIPLSKRQTVIHLGIMGVAGTYNGEYSYTPAGAVAAQIDGKPETFDTLAQAINARLNKNFEYYKTELKIDIPFLTGFSRNPDGSSPSWKNLTLGSKHVHEGKEYLIVSIERNYANWKTTIKATRTSKYAYSEPVPITKSMVPPPPTPGTSQNIAVAGEVIKAGSPVATGSDGKLYLFCAHHSFYGRFAGVSALGGALDSKVIYNEYGRVFLQGAEFEPGRKLFVGADSTITTTPLSAKTENEDLFIEIGRTTEKPNLIYVEKGTEAIFFPPIPEP